MVKNLNIVANGEMKKCKNRDNGYSQNEKDQTVGIWS